MFRLERELMKEQEKLKALKKAAALLNEHFNSVDEPTDEWGIRRRY